MALSQPQSRPLSQRLSSPLLQPQSRPCPSLCHGLVPVPVTAPVPASVMAPGPWPITAPAAAPSWLCHDLCHNPCHCPVPALGQLTCGADSVLAQDPSPGNSVTYTVSFLHNLAFRIAGDPVTQPPGTGGHCEAYRPAYLPQELGTVLVSMVLCQVCRCVTVFIS